MKIFLDEDGKQIAENEALDVTHTVIEFDGKTTKAELDEQRAEKLKGFVIDNIFLNKEVIKDMAVKYTTLADHAKAKWIDVDNNIVEFTKAELGALVKKGTDRVEAIYFKYRQLKDKLLKGE